MKIANFQSNFVHCFFCVCVCVPTSDLRILTNSFAVGTGRRIIFTFTEGTNLTAILSLNGVSQSATVDYTSKQILSDPFDVPNVQSVSYDLYVTDLVGKTPISGSASFDIPVGKLTCTITPQLVVFYN